MLDARKSAILRKIVSEHIETGEPVGSQHVVRDQTIDVSAATVRAEMVTLERDGYLTHPHTSAGRVPTDLGYRFFVDHLGERDGLDPLRAEQVSEFFTRAHGELDSMLRDTSRFLSTLTDYAALVVGPPHETLLVRSALVTRLAPSTAMVVVVLSNGFVDKQVFEIDVSLPDDDFEAANTILRRHFAGQTLSGLSAPPPSSSTGVDAIISSCVASFNQDHTQSPEQGEVYIGGAANMANQFATVDTVRQILAILEESLVVVTLLSEVVAKGNTVSIGAENEVKSLAECSLVVSPYQVGEEVVGTIGVLGPTRMNYSQALAAVAVVSKRLGQQLAGE
ncbi:MAG TPA: heat-inducible transcriptional repressor HrcA [Acidimicrobiales bacterium]|nr:heat-inducible transcriptional repressor HrcA [Acidimicrobiales bacterium]